MEVFTVLWTSVLGLFIYWIYRKIREPFETVASWNIFLYPGAKPIVGNWVPDTAPFDRDLIQNYKHHKVVASIAFRLANVTILDLDLVKTILVKDFHLFSDRLLLAINPSPMNRSLFSLTHNHWKHVRGLVSPTFTTGKLKGMHDLLLKAADNALHHLSSRPDHRTPVLAKDFFTRFTLDAIARTLFGLDINPHLTQDHPFVRAALQAFNTTLTNPALLFAFLTPELLKIITKYGSFLMNVGAIEYFRKIVEEALSIRRRESGAENRHDFLQIVADSEIQDSECDKVSIHEKLGHICRWSEKGLTRDEIVGQAIVFMAAGFETTATTLQLLAYNMAIHQDIQAKVYEEIEKVLADKTEVAYEDLTKFEYLDLCIQETMRLYPPVARISRICKQTVQYDDVTIQEGTLVTVPIYALQMDPEVYPEPEKFDPERFRVKRGMSFLPFGEGPRGCVGKRLAWQEMRLLIVKLLKEFRIEACDETQAPEELDMVYKGFIILNTPIKIRIVPR